VKYWIALTLFGASSLACAVCMGLYLRKLSRRHAEDESGIVRALRERGWM